VAERWLVRIVWQGAAHGCEDQVAHDLCWLGQASLLSLASRRISSGAQEVLGAYGSMYVSLQPEWPLTPCCRMLVVSELTGSAVGDAVGAWVGP